MTLPVTYTTAEVAKAFNVSTDYLLDLVKDGKVRPARTSASIRGQYRWFDEHVEQVKTAMQAMTPAAPAAPQPRRRRKRAA